MRAIIIVIAILALTRFGFNEYLDRTAKTDVIVTAYREHAIAACQLKGEGATSPDAWTNPASLQLTIGKRDLDVYVWQTNHRLWKARYRNAYLYLTLEKASENVYCEYDISNDIASVHKAGNPTVKTDSGQPPTSG